MLDCRNGLGTCDECKYKKRLIGYNKTFQCVWINKILIRFGKKTSYYNKCQKSLGRRKIR